jgi:hypothetical protein
LSILTGAVPTDLKATVVFLVQYLGVEAPESRALWSCLWFRGAQPMPSFCVLIEALFCYGVHFDGLGSGSRRNDYFEWIMAALGVIVVYTLLGYALGVVDYSR